MERDVDKAAHYNSQYEKENYFGYKEWMYDRYIASLIQTAGLKEGSTVLDVGCGQGFFSNLFRKHGMNVHGIDISEVGIREASKAYGQLGVNFSVADFETMNSSQQFDCVFVRSCSLYNRSDFSMNNDMTLKLLSHVRSLGVLIFVYNSNFSSKRSDSWRFHSWDDLVRHFHGCPNAKFFFSTKIDACLLGKYAVTSFVTKANIMLSKMLGVGGDLICILQR